MAVDLAEILFLGAGEDVRTAGEGEAEEECGIDRCAREDGEQKGAGKLCLRANQAMAAEASARNAPAAAARNAMTASGAGKFRLLLGGIHMVCAPHCEVLCYPKKRSDELLQLVGVDLSCAGSAIVFQVMQQSKRERHSARWKYQRPRGSPRPFPVRGGEKD